MHAPNPAREVLMWRPWAPAVYHFPIWVNQSTAMRFFYGLRQPTFAVRVIIKLNDERPFAAIDRWISEALEANVDDYSPAYIAGVSPDTDVFRYVRRWLLVATVLLQDLRVPVFERAIVTRVSKAAPKSDDYAVDIGFPSVENFPVKLFHAALKIADDLLRKPPGRLGDPVERDAIYQGLQEKFVEPWSKHVPGGKSTVPVLQAAFELGIPVSHCGAGRYVLGWGGRSRMFYRSSNGNDSAIGAASTQNKYIAIQMMRRAGIPVPRGLLADSRELSFKAVSHLSLPVVVKPVDRDRGEGVTVGVCDDQGFRAAMDSAFRLSTGVLVEEQASGVCHRILLIDGKVGYVVRRNPRSLQGDGVHTVRELAERENAAIMKKIPLKRLPLYELDEIAGICIARQGLDLDSIPAAGQRVALRDVQSTVWGGDPEVLTDALHPDNLEIAARAARLFGLECAGVDFISEDISVPWYDNGAVINEVNYAPVIGRTHAYQRNGIKVYLESVFPHRGRIPIEVFVGSGMQAAALTRQREYIARGENCFLCTGEVVDHQGRQLQFADAANVGDAIGMLRTERRMDALVIHLDDAMEVLKNGFPFEYVSRLVCLSPGRLDKAQAGVVNQLKAFLQPGDEPEYAAS